jgi:hypothetical protein
MLEACAIAHSPGMEWLTFVTCMYSSYNQVPKVGQACAAKAQLDWATLETCYGNGSGAEGKKLIAVR